MKKTLGYVAVTALVCLIIFVLSSQLSVAFDNKINQMVDQKVEEALSGQGNDIPTINPPETTPVGPSTIPEVSYDDDKYADRELSAIFENAKKSLVSITNMVYSNDNPDSLVVDSTGSGVIVGDDGHELWILTSYHVIEHARRIDVQFNTGSAAEVYIKGYNVSYDIAVLAVKLDDITEETRNSIAVIKADAGAELRPGDTVIAIGDVLHMGPTITKGIISAVNVPVTLYSGYTINMTQVDAAINAGASGGMILNERGHLIAVPAAKNILCEVDNIGYAVPLHDVWTTIVELCNREGKSLAIVGQEAYLGVELVECPLGVLVQNIQPHTGAFMSELCVGDYIAEFNGMLVGSINDLKTALWLHRPGDIITVKVMRPNGKDYVYYNIMMTLRSK